MSAENPDRPATITITKAQLVAVVRAHEGCTTDELWAFLTDPLAEYAYLEASLERLREFVRKFMPGGCRVLSQGPSCRCLLCDLGRLGDVLAEAKRQRIGLVNWQRASTR